MFIKQVDLIIREAEELAKRIQDEANDIIEEIMNNAHERVYLQNNNIKKDKMTIEELTEIVDDIVITDDDKVSKKRKGTSISVNDYYEDILKKWNQKASEILDLNNIEEMAQQVLLIAGVLAK